MGAGPGESEPTRPDAGIPTPPWAPAPPAVAPWDDPDWKSKKPVAPAPAPAKKTRAKKAWKPERPTGSTPAALWVCVALLAVGVAALVPVAIRKPTLRQATSEDRVEQLLQKALRDPQNAPAIFNASIAEGFAQGLLPQPPFDVTARRDGYGELDVDAVASLATEPKGEERALRREGLDAAYRAGWQRPDGGAIDVLVTHFDEEAGATIHTERVAAATGLHLPPQATASRSATSLRPGGGSYLATLLFQEGRWSVEVTLVSGSGGPIDEVADDLAAQIEDQLEVIPP